MGSELFNTFVSDKRINTTRTMENFSKNYDLIPEEFTIIGWGYPEPEMDDNGHVFTHPVFDFTDSKYENDITPEEVKWLEDSMYDGSQHCNHCGQQIKYFALVKHDDGRAHVIGTQCASSMIGYRQEKVDSMHKTTLKARQKIDRVQKVRKAKVDGQAFLDTVDGLEKALETKHYITESLRDNLFKYGKMSEKQVALVFKLEQDVKERALEMAKREAEGKASKHYGEVGERIRDHELEVVFCKAFESNFGWFHIVKFKDNNGNFFAYKGSVDFPKGYKCIAAFTVKEHSEYRGEKQTVIQRIKDVEIKDGKAA